MFNFTVTVLEYERSEMLRNYYESVDFVHPYENGITEWLN